MKIIIYITILIPSLYLPLNANQLESISPSVKELLIQVKQAPDKQKRILINQLKLRLKNMNKESRKEAMIELKKSFLRKGIHHERGYRQHRNSSHIFNHQPKFRYLRQGLRDGSGSKHGLGNRHK